MITYRDQGTRIPEHNDFGVIVGAVGNRRDGCNDRVFLDVAYSGGIQFGRILWESLDSRSVSESAGSVQVFSGAEDKGLELLTLAAAESPRRTDGDEKMTESFMVEDVYRGTSTNMKTARYVWASQLSLMVMMTSGDVFGW